MSISVKDFGDYSVKSVKSFMGREGLGFNANLYRGKKKVAFCYDDASGGMVDIDWDRNIDWEAEQKLLDDHIKKLPKVESSYGDNMELTIDDGWFVSDLVTKWETEKDIRKLKKQCATKTLFRHSKCKVGSYVIMSAICNDTIRAKIRKDYGKDVEIFNDVLAEDKLPSIFQS